MEHFKNKAAADKFADQLLALLTDTYYVWTEDTNSWRGKVKKCHMARRGTVPPHAEQVFTGQSVSHAIQEMKYNGWRNISHHGDFVAAAEEVGFTVCQYENVRVITL